MGQVLNLNFKKRTDGTPTVPSAVRVLRMHAAMVRDIYTKHAVRKDFLFQSIEEIVMACGSVMPLRPLPIKHKPMKMGECFRNAVLFSNFGIDYTYCEGFAVGPHAFPVHHAWVMDKAGNAYDPTWCNTEHGTGYVYLGIPFTKQYVNRQALRLGVYGLMTDYDRKCCENLRRLFEKGLPVGALANNPLQRILKPKTELKIVSNPNPTKHTRS